MSFTLGGKGGTVSELNVVPLIDILLVLLVIFMIVPHEQMGLRAQLPQVTETDPRPFSETIIVTVRSDGSFRINQLAIQREELRGSLERIFALRASKVAFLQGDSSLEFHAVAQTLDLMHTAGATSVGLLTSELEKNR
jgi:biopolymer transport protein ExbD/biopolymer transport protein TolR